MVTCSIGVELYCKYINQIENINCETTKLHIAHMYIRNVNYCPPSYKTIGAGMSIKTKNLNYQLKNH